MNGTRTIAFWARVCALVVAVAIAIPVLRMPASVANAGPASPATYGLKTGKPFNGTKLHFLICCLAAGQFAQLRKLTAEGAEFHQLTGISADWDNVPWPAFPQKLLVEITSGNEYDVATWVDSWGHAFKPFLVPLNERIRADNIDLKDFPPVYLQAASDTFGKGIVYGIPFRGHPLLLFYRKDVLDALSLQVPKTWQELLRTARTIQERRPGMKGVAMYYGINAGQNLFLWLSHIWGVGGDVFDKDYRPIFNNAAGVRGTQEYVDILARHKLTADGSVTFSEGEADTEFAQGRAGMFVNWWWRWSNYKNPQITAAGVMGNIAFAPAPGYEGSTSSQTYGHIWPVGILKSSRKQDAAWEFIKYITHQEVEKRVALNKSVPAESNNVVVHFSNMYDPKVNEANDGVPRAGAEVLKTARTQPLVTTWAEVQSVLEVAINELAKGADVKRTLDRAAAEVDAIQRRGGYYR